MVNIGQLWRLVRLAPTHASYDKETGMKELDPGTVALSQVRLALDGFLNPQ